MSQFLNLNFVIYRPGSADDKLRLIFNMYDVDKSDSLHVDEIKEVSLQPIRGKYSSHMTSDSHFKFKASRQVA